MLNGSVNLVKVYGGTTATLSNFHVFLLGFLLCLKSQRIAKSRLVVGLRGESHQTRYRDPMSCGLLILAQRSSSQQADDIPLPTPRADHSHIRTDGRLHGLPLLRIHVQSCAIVWSADP